tara:strand:+ start:138 stop:617 length:480 start_codon:yes stop_codon:yes gene_type:complete
MAVQSADLKVSIRETITLNNNKYDSFVNHTITGINEISKRIMTIPTEESQTIVNIGGSVANGGFVSSSIKYVRISNLNDSSNPHHVDLTFQSEDNDEFAVRLDHGNTFMYPATQTFGVSGSMDAIDANEANLTQMASLKAVEAKASGSTVDIELFIAST